MGNKQTQGQVKVFRFDDAVDIRTAGSPDEPWFCLTDVCDALAIGSPHKVAERVDEEGRSSIPTPTAGGIQPMTYVDEGALYEVVMTSRKPEAKRFKRWVTREVLPTIRKTGRYDARRPANDDREIKLALARAKEERLLMREQRLQGKWFVELADDLGLESNARTVFVQSNLERVGIAVIPAIAKPEVECAGQMNATELVQAVGVDESKRVGAARTLGSVSKRIGLRDSSGAPVHRDVYVRYTEASHSKKQVPQDYYGPDAQVELLSRWVAEYGTKYSVSVGDVETFLARRAAA